MDMMHLCSANITVSRASFDEPADNHPNMFCGVCWVDAGPQCGVVRGRWQQYGDWRENEKKWVYMCSGCSRYLWRLYSKDEGDLRDLNMDLFYKDFTVFLESELQRRRASS